MEQSLKSIIRVFGQKIMFYLEKVHISNDSGESFRNFFVKLMVSSHYKIESKTCCRCGGTFDTIRNDVSLINTKCCRICMIICLERTANFTWNFRREFIRTTISPIVNFTGNFNKPVFLIKKLLSKRYSLDYHICR